MRGAPRSRSPCWAGGGGRKRCSPHQRVRLARIPPAPLFLEWAGALLLLAATLAAGSWFSANEALMRSYVFLPGGARVAMDVLHQTLVLGAAGAVCLRARTREGALHGLALVAALDVCLTTNRFL